MLVKHEQLTEQIIKAFYTVCHALGYGFLEKVYENSLALELRKIKLAVVQQAEIQVHYAGVVVGKYCADLLVADAVIVEVKATLAPSRRSNARCTTTNARGDWPGDKGNKDEPQIDMKKKSSVLLRVNPCPIPLGGLRRSFARRLQASIRRDWRYGYAA